MGGCAGWNGGSGPEFVIGIELVGVELRRRREGWGSCFSFHDFAAAANGFGMRHPRRLLKPPISDIWSKGGRAFAAQREKHGSRGDGDRRRWSGSKCDGLIKDDHNWGGRRKEQKPAEEWGMLSPSLALSVYLARARQLLNGRGRERDCDLGLVPPPSFLWKNAIDG